ncbi:hypothetical protein DLJ53_10115 [Acuticoccus sediminis]|uniref:Lactate dehydrogenase-like 2-hydroxyacid dehydrogenase n=1 Tax=Acuticoccus sediminis TaxID=2184697 RepID=A0A8B2NWL4_9HYPH|nr:2-hydroxyacid dehydrogenase [Acuticoccus sediminis]RAI01752.1 hypothetical protein DLJ53_10115 [Acuticoccus sediminis]
MAEILVTGRTAAEHWMETVAAHHTLHRIGAGTDREPVLAAAAPVVRALVSGGGFTVDAALMDRLPHLGLIVVTGAGFDRIDVAAAKARGIGVCNAPSATATCVADMAMGLYLAVGREIVTNDRFVREGRWLAGRPATTRRVSHRRAGIWGLGSIGEEIAKRATGFAMDVHYCTRRPREGVPYRHHARLLDLAEAVDVLFCAVPATPETSGAVDRSVLKALGPRGILVNIARGSVVDQPALIEALRTGTIAGAGLDVFTDEPQVPAELIAMDNVVLGPHAAGSTDETWQDVITAVLDNVDVYLREGRYLTPVS